MRVCVCCGHHFQQTGNQPVLVVAAESKRKFPCCGAWWEIWSRQLDSYFMFRICPLVVHTQAESGARPSHFPLQLPPETQCAIDSVSPSYQVTQMHVDDVHHAESPTAQGHTSAKYRY